MSRQRLAAALLALLTLVAAAYVAERWRGGAPVETDLLALLPSSEKHPLAQQAIEQVTRTVGERAVFVLSGPSFARAVAAAREVGTLLGKQTEAFGAVQAEVPRIDARLPVAVYGPHRGHLLLPEDARALALDPRAFLEARLAERLHAPMVLGPRTTIDEDPFGLLQRFLARLPVTSRLGVREGMLWTEHEGRHYVFVIAQPLGSPFDARAQRAAVAAADLAAEHLRKFHGEVDLAHTGAVYHGAAARAQAEAEMNRIGSFSLVAVLALLGGVFRSWRHLWLGLLPIAAGVLVATAASLYFFGRLHLLTLGCGATLIGIAVDYSLHYFAAQLGAGENWRAELAMDTLRPALALGSLSTCAGYGLLLLFPFPGLQQMALFSVAGVIMAALAVTLWLPGFLQKPLASSTRGALRFPQALLRRGRNLYAPRRVAWVVAGLSLVAVPGWYALAGNDDVRLLVAPAPALQKTDALLRDLAGVGGGNQFFVVEGGNEDELARRERGLREALQALRYRGALNTVSAISDWVPPTAEQAASHMLLLQLWRAGHIQGALRGAGFLEAAIEREGAALAASTPFTRAAWAASPLGKPIRHLILSEQASLVLPEGHRHVAPLAQAAQGLPGVTLIDKPGSVSALLQVYRGIVAGVLLAAWPVAAGLLARRYGWRGGAILAAPATLAIAFTLAVLGWLGENLTLFHLLALFLVFGVGIDYSIFLFEAGTTQAAALLGVLLAAATTLLSFGLLALSGMPALRGFGLTLVLGVGFSLLGAPAVMAGRTAEGDA